MAGLEVMAKIETVKLPGLKPRSLITSQRNRNPKCLFTNKANTALTDVNSFVTARDIFMENNRPSFEYWDVTKIFIYIYFVMSCFKLRLAIGRRLAGLYREDERRV